MVVYSVIHISYQYIVRIIDRFPLRYEGAPKVTRKQRKQSKRTNNLTGI